MVEIGTLGAADYGVVAAMLVISMGIGIYFRFAGGRQRTTGEFLMAGRNMSPFPVAFSLMATFQSAIAMLGFPAEVYMYGTQVSLKNLGTVIGAAISSCIFLPVFFNVRLTTAYEYLEKRFGKLTRNITSGFFMFQMIMYMSVVLYAPALAMSAVTGLWKWTSIISLGVVCTFYCTLGGMKAVIWTDVFQSLLMFTGIFAVIIKGTTDLGGIGAVLKEAENGGRLEFFNFDPDPTVRYTFWNCLISGIVFIMSTYGSNQAQVQRLLTVNNLSKAKTALYWSVPLIVGLNILNCMIGVVVYANLAGCDPMLRPESTRVHSRDQILPYYIMKTFSQMPGMAGLCIAGIFSGSLSTISSAVNSLTAVTMEDIIRRFRACKNLTEKRAAILAKGLALLYGGLCILLTVVVENFAGVMEASNAFLGMVGGPIFGLFALGMLTKRTDQKAAIIGMFTAFALCAWIGFGSTMAKLLFPPLSQSTETCPDSFSLTSEITSALYNVTESPLNNTTSFVVEKSQKYVFPLYKISYTLFPTIGFVTCVVVGYLSSFLPGEKHKVAPELLSPIISKWQRTEVTTNGDAHDMEMKKSPPCETKETSPE